MTRAFIGEPDYDYAAELTLAGQPSARDIVDAALRSMTVIDLKQIHGGFTDTEEHEFTQWISEWKKETTES